MAEVYPPVLIACIRDGKFPTDIEVEQVATKTWEEGVRFLNASSPSLAFHLVRQALSVEQCSPD